MFQEASTYSIWSSEDYFPGHVCGDELGFSVNSTGLWHTTVTCQELENTMNVLAASISGLRFALWKLLLQWMVLLSRSEERKIHRWKVHAKTALCHSSVMKIECSLLASLGAFWVVNYVIILPQERKKTFECACICPYRSPKCTFLK